MKTTRRAGGGQNTARDPRDDGADCDHCPLKNAGPAVFGAGPEDATVAVIGEGPGGNEVKDGIPFTGQSGILLDEILMKTGLPRSSVYLDNATLHMPPGGDLQAFINSEKKKAKARGEVFKSPVDCCRPRLFKALNVPRCRSCDKFQLGPKPCDCKQPTWSYPQGSSCSPELVIPAGNAALEALTGLSGIMKWRGSPINTERLRKGELSTRIEASDEEGEVGEDGSGDSQDG